MVKPIPPMDLLFYLTETAENPKHVGVVEIYQKPEDAGDNYMLELVKQLRQAPVEEPFNLKPRLSLGRLPCWEEVPDMEMEYHVRHLALPSPGKAAQLMDAVQRFHAGAMDRRRPGFICWVIEGLEGNRFALYMKGHHAYIDGVSGVKRLFGTLDRAPRKGVVRPVWSYKAATKTKAKKRSGWGISSRLGELETMIANQFTAMNDLGNSFAEIGFELMNLRKHSGYIPFSAPRTRMNLPVDSDLRSVSVLSLQLSKVRAIAAKSECTVNDVFLAIIDAALQEYLKGHGEAPEKPLVAMIPMSLREEDDEQPNTQIAALLVELGEVKTGLTQRLETISASANRSKQHARSMSKEGLIDFVLLVGGFFEFLQRTGLEASMPPSYNVLASNVAGRPDKDLYLADARLVASYPVSTLAPGCNLNITVISHGDNFDIGLLAHKHTIPDPEKITHSMEKNYRALLRHCQLNASD